MELTRKCSWRISIYSGIIPFKRTEKIQPECLLVKEGQKEPIRRFHYVSLGMPAKRLSTAFDQCYTLRKRSSFKTRYLRKNWKCGRFHCCLDDAKKLYSGFDLVIAMTSVSMTINGPAPMLLGFL